MSVLTAAQSRFVMRGFEYYKAGNVLSFDKISDCEYEGYVKGSQSEPYHIILNIEQPKKSICSCPYADSDNVICKHMIALYFAIFEDEAQDYESWLNSNHYDDDDDYNYFDEDDDDEDYYDDYYDDDDEYDSQRYSLDYFVRPLCFDKLVDDYVNSFSYDELKENLKNDLLKNEAHAFNYLLKDRYREFIENSDGYYGFLENLNIKLTNFSKVYDYDYCDFNKEILSKEEKNIITRIYDDVKFRDLLNSVLLRKELCVYRDYLWVIEFYKDKLKVKDKDKLCSDIDDLFNSLKHYGIKNTIPKSNTLISLYILNDFSIESCVKSLLTNAKYEEYVLYVINDVDDAYKLYDYLIKEINKYHGFNKQYIPNVLLYFNNRFKDDSKQMERVLVDSSYFDFMFNYRKESLAYVLKVSPNMISKIEKNAKRIEQLIPLYEQTNQIEKLYSLIKTENKEYLYNNSIDSLKDMYNDELYEYYKNKIYDSLINAKSRDEYRITAGYFAYIKKLNNGDELVDKTIQELKNSKYQNRPALFDEIRNRLNITKRYLKGKY